MTPASSTSRRPGPPSTALARALSKLGFCSRQEAIAAALAGRVLLNGHVERDPGRRVDLQRDRIEVDGRCVGAAPRVYLMLNKPAGLITTRVDEQGRDTVYRCLNGESLPHLSPVGRLDRASEGLLLFTNDTAWAAHITDPFHHVLKIYHVQINRVADDALTTRLARGVTDQGDFLTAKSVRILRQGDKHSWLEIALDEGRNRHIRRLLAAFGLEVLRLVRVAIGPLRLGDLPKGGYRHLTPREVKELRR
jgi:23S rRNA pseudouridine2605 synthase